MKKNRKIFLLIVLLLLLFTAAVFFFITAHSPPSPPEALPAPQTSAAAKSSAPENQPTQKESLLTDSEPSFAASPSHEEMPRTATARSGSTGGHAFPTVFQTGIQIRTIRQSEIIDMKPTGETGNRLDNAIRVFAQNFQALLIFNADGSTLNTRPAALYSDPALDATLEIKNIYLSLLKAEKGNDPQNLAPQSAAETPK